ncbi:thiamine phosphate synthase [Flavobacterium sp. SM2513]|uniref:thiamine phosphate synthase n=1 Tax=Flavobacterium sp. SM2513 TaxID=3424766 RepID=UPI003D7F7558
MKNNFPFQLYLILSEEACLNEDFCKVAEQAILGGVDLVQLREKNCSTDNFKQKALRLQDVLTKHSIPLIINDNLEVALSVGAYGIHVGANDIAPLEIRKQWAACQSIGYSIEDIQQMDSISAQLSDCFGVSPVYKTNTKTDTIIEWGLDGLEKIRKSTDKPLIAIGNMNTANVYEVIKAGADCIAISSFICQAKNPQQVAYEIKQMIQRAL